MAWSNEWKVNGMVHLVLNGVVTLMEGWLLFSLLMGWSSLEGPFYR